MTKFRAFAIAAAAAVTAGFSVMPAIAATKVPDSAVLALYDALSASPEPRDRVLAAGMTVPRTDDERSERRMTFAFAAAAAPKDPLVQWLAANAFNGCPKAPEDSATLRLFRQIEPDNAVSDLLQLNRYAACGDKIRINATLEQMARAKRFDSHFGTTVQAWLAILAGEPTANALLHPAGTAGGQGEAPLTLAFAFATAEAEPDFKPLLDACRDKSNAYAGACAMIGHTLAYSSKTALDRTVGFELIARSGKMTAADAAALRELHWLITPPSDKTHSAVMGRAIATGWRAGDDELLIMRQAFLDAGLSPTPPANWVDPTGKQPVQGQPGSSQLPHWNAPVGTQSPQPQDNPKH